MTINEKIEEIKMYSRKSDRVTELNKLREHIIMQSDISTQLRLIYINIIEVRLAMEFK